LKELKDLKVRQYQNPELLSSSDEDRIKTLERMKFSQGRTPSVTPSPTVRTPTSDSTSSSTSVKSSYAALVDENRLWKKEYVTIKLSDYDKEMENCLEHFKSSATYTAAFLLFIRHFCSSLKCFSFYLISVYSKTVHADEVSQVDALRVAEYLFNMFDTTKRGEDRAAIKFQTRDQWMKFLNAAYSKFFNPIFPNHSGIFYICLNLLSSTVACQEMKRQQLRNLWLVLFIVFFLVLIMPLSMLMKNRKFEW
jgi:hypothetical protein